MENQDVLKRIISPILYSSDRMNILAAAQQSLQNYKKKLISLAIHTIQRSMLPLLKRSKQEFQASQIKLYHPPRQLSNLENKNEKQQRRMSSHNNTKTSSSKMAKHTKVKANTMKRGETFSGGSTIEKGQQTFKKESVGSEYGNSFPQKLPNQSTMMGIEKRDLNAEIKLIEKKIRYHKKKLQEQKKKKELQNLRKQDPYDEDFSKIVKKQMELQGIVVEEENKGFDYLTNPGKAKEEEEVQNQQQPKVVQVSPSPAPPKKFDLNEKIEKLEKHYENNLKKKFERREMFPHQACKRKTPKLYITHQTNALQKFGKRPAPEEHNFRIMTKECTPQEIYPTIPNFAVVKDNLSKNVMAYLSDFKPFIEKTQEEGEELSEDLMLHQNREEQQVQINSEAEGKPKKLDSNRRVVHQRSQKSGETQFYQPQETGKVQQEQQMLKRA